MSRILIIRTSALGDVVQALPVLRALRRHLTGATIGWVIEEAFAPLLDRHPDLDRVIPVRLRHWRKTPFAPATLGEIIGFLSALQGFAAEIVLDLMGNHKAGVLAALALADRRIGFARAFRRESSSALWLSETVTPRTRHSVDKMLAVLDALDLPIEPADFGGDYIPDAGTGAASSPRSGARRVLIHPGAGWDNKRYPPQRWGEVAAQLEQMSGCRSDILVGLGESQLTETVVAASQGAATAVEAPDLLQLTSLLRRSDLVMGGDTGPVHLAHALGRPVLCLMGPTDPATCGPYGATDRVIWRQLPCSFCHKRYAGTKPCLEQIDPAVVVARAADILENRPLRASGPIEQGEAGCLILH